MNNTSKHQALLLALDARHRRALVVGGGEVGRRRAVTMLRAGAVVDLVAPGPEALTVWHEAHPDVRWRRRPFEVDDLEGCDLIFACTDNAELNAHIAREARRRGLWCNVADWTSPGDFNVLTGLRRGPVTVAISSGGGAPGVSKALRVALESTLPPEWATLAKTVSSLRRQLQRTCDDPKERTVRMRALMRALSPGHLRRGDEEALHALIAEHLNLNAEDLDLHVTHTDAPQGAIATQRSTAAPPTAPDGLNAAPGDPESLAEPRPVVLISGFGPFPGVPHNPSPEVASEAARILRALRPDLDVEVVELMTHFDRAWELLRESAEALRQNAERRLVGVFPLGVATRSEVVRLERVAINHRGGQRADASGHSAPATGQPLLAHGPDGLMARYPIDQVHQNLHAAGLSDVAISNSAGTYLCNEVFYKLMAWSNATEFEGRGGFIHIPPVPEALTQERVAQIVAHAIHLACPPEPAPQG